MTDTTNPRARLDVALEEMRSTMGSSSQPVRLTAEATVACAEALSLLVDAHRPEPEPEPDPSRAKKAEAELRASELLRFEVEQSEGKAAVERANAIAERDNAIAALRSIRNELAKLAVGYFAEGDDARSAYRESMQVVDGEARRRGLDLGVATA